MIYEAKASVPLITCKPFITLRHLVILSSAIDIILQLISTVVQQHSWRAIFIGTNNDRGEVIDGILWSTGIADPAAVSRSASVAFAFSICIRFVNLLLSYMEVCRQRLIYMGITEALREYEQSLVSRPRLSRFYVFQSFL